MIFTAHSYAEVEDPLVAALGMNRPVTADVLRMAIRYHESCQDRHAMNIGALKKALAHLIGVPPAAPALQESARHVGASEA